MKAWLWYQSTLVTAISALQARQPGVSSDNNNHSRLNRIARAARSETVYYNVSSLDTGVSTTPTLTSRTTVLRSVLSTQADCIANSTVTYTHSVNPTVYVTVSSSYEVVIAATDVSMVNAPIIVETPATACISTIVPLDTQTPASSDPPDSQESPTFMSIESGPHFSLTVGYRVTTSTVIVTKKTPVPVVEVPQSTDPPVSFGPNPTDGTAEPSDGITGPGPNVTPKINNNNDVLSTASEPSTVNFVQIIDSVTNSLFAGPPSAQAAAGTIILTPSITATIAGVVIAIDPSTVVIGGSSVLIPAATQSPATIVANGKTFTILQSEILGPGTTYSIPTPVVISAFVQTASIVTVDGIPITIGASQAVILGTTYHIGVSAAQTSVVISGRTISIGPRGVGYASTTLAPPITIAGDRYELVVIGGVTALVDATVAIISGTTFSIGPGATSTTTIIAGNTITFGPGGIIFASTTIEPTSIPTAYSTSSMPVVTASTARSGGVMANPTASSTNMAAKASGTPSNSASRSNGSKSSSFWAIIAGLSSIAWMF